MKKKIFIGLIAFILLAITLGLYTLNNRLDPANLEKMQANGLTTTTTSVEKMNLVSEIQTNGNVKAEESEEFSPEPGKKVKYYVQDGEEVTKGDLLYQILDAELELQYKQALADRKQLTKASTASTTSTTNTTNPAPTNSPNLKDINYQINTLKERMEANKIKAPFAGIISIINNPAGSPGNQPTTVRISNLTSLIIPVNIEEVNYPLLKVGQKATVKLTAYGDRKFTGTVNRISKEAFNKDGTVTIPVIIKLAQNPSILPGMSADVSITISTKNNVLALPSEYIQQNEKGEYFVSLVQGNKKDTDKVNPESPQEVRTVKIGLKNDTHTEIMSGLKEGEVVQANVPQASVMPVK